MNVFKYLLTACLACSLFSLSTKQETVSNQEKQEEIIIEDTGIELSDLSKNRFSTLKRERRVARFYSGLPTSDDGWEYASFFTLNGKVAYCIEPLVLVILDQAGNGPAYSESIQFQDYDLDTKHLLMRIMWFGYGNPLIGTSDEAWLATQLLIWKTTVPNEYDQIINSLQWCGDSACKAVGNQADVSTMMDQILNLVYNRDTAPSFANQDKTCKSYEIDWDETLILTDDGSSNPYSSSSVLDWFNETPNESHDGINIKKVGNSLYIDIDSLFYEGYDEENGKTLTFNRKQEATNNALMGNLIWISGNSQRILTASGHDPTFGYSLSFKLKTADLEIIKLDEYGINSPLAQGTTFWIGWMEDPLQQYHQDGLADENWKELYDFHQSTIHDETKEFYHLITENNQPKEFVVDEQGKLIIEDFLPQNKSWWIKEVKASNPFQINGTIWEAKTLEENTVNQYSFVNLLKDVQLDCIKQNSTSKERLNDTEFIIYEIANENQPLDLDRSETILGPIENQIPMPFLSYNQVLSALGNPLISDTLHDEYYQYTLIQEDKENWIFCINQNEEETLTVAKPKQIVWEDYLNANEPEENSTFLCLRDNKEYKVLYKDTQAVWLMNTSNQEIFSLKENNQFETEKLLFIQKDKAVDLSQYLPILNEKEVEIIYPDNIYAKIDGNILFDEKIETFLLQIKGKQSDSLNKLIEYLKQKSIIQDWHDLSLNQQLIINKITYTIQEIKINQAEELESITLSGPNRLDENKTNLYHLSNQTNNYADLILESYRVVIINQSENKEIEILEALPFAKVTTGKNAIRISDPFNHNLPVSDYPISIYQSIDGLDLIKEASSDEYGMVNTDDLEPGTYFHSTLNSSLLKEFTVYSKDYLKGEAKITDLKWGRTYLACEIKPTEGYEYEQICQSFSPNYDLNITNSTLIFNNQLKKIELNLIKQDKQDPTYLLNGAYFSIRKLTNENTNTINHLSSLSSKLTYDDLPEQFNVNDTFTVEYHQGNKQTYRIQAIEYYDNDAFINSENDVAFSTVQFVTVFNINDESKYPIVLKSQAFFTPELSGDEYFPIQETGSIYFKKTVNKPLEKLIWDDLTAILGNNLNAEQSNIQKGKTFKIMQEASIQAPSWNDIKDKDFLIQDGFIFNTVYYTIEKITDNSITLSYTNANQKKALYLLTENSPVTTVSVLQEIQYTIKEVYTQSIKEKEMIIGVIVESKQDEILLYPNQYATYGEYPQEGVVFEIYDKSNPELLIQTATTNFNGEIEVSKDAYGNPLNGTYLIKESGSDESIEFKVEPGKIILSDIDYGTKLEICEIKAPTGYQAQGCIVETIETDDLDLTYTISITNQKKDIQIPKMGEE